MNDETPFIYPEPPPRVARGEREDEQIDVMRILMADGAARSVRQASNAEDVDNASRNSMIDALWGNNPETDYESWKKFDRRRTDYESWKKFDRRRAAVIDALSHGDAAVRLAIEVAGADCHVEWFWNSCNGHRAEVMTVDVHNGLVKEGYSGGASMALSIVAALLRWVAAEPKPSPRDSGAAAVTEMPVVKGAKPRLVTT